MAPSGTDIVRGNLLYARPHFREGPKNEAALRKEHPVIVLQTNQDPSNLLAFVIPISSTPILAGKPDSVAVPPGLIRGLKGSRTGDSWFCTDSPNFIYINGDGNKLRINPINNTHHRFCHGNTNNQEFVDMLLDRTLATMAKNGYKPPKHGESSQQARVFLENERLRRIDKAASMESHARQAAVPSMTEAYIAAAALQHQPKRAVLGLKGRSQDR